MNEPALLPPLLAEISDVAGEDAARVIAAAVGGTRVLIPKQPGKNWLTRLVGEEKTQAIIDRLGASIPYDIPLGKAPISRAVDALLDAGLSNRGIARRLGITERTVRLRKAQRQQRPFLSQSRSS